MKKLGYILLLAFLFTGVFQLPVLAGDNIRLFINDQEKFTDPAPFIDRQTERTYVPIRFIAESLGAEVTYAGAEQKVVIKQPQGDKTILLFINNNQAYVNEAVVYMDAAARIVSDRTVVPLRFVAENLDVDVRWDGNNKIIALYSGQAMVSKPDIEPILLPDGTTVRINLLPGWQYQKGTLANGPLFLLTHKTGATVNLVVEELTEKMPRNDYIAASKNLLIQNYGAQGMEEEDQGDVYTLGYTVTTVNGQTYVIQSLIFPVMDSDYMIEDLVGVFTTALPDSLTQDEAYQVLEESSELVIYE